MVNQLIYPVQHNIETGSESYCKLSIVSLNVTIMEHCIKISSCPIFENVLNEEQALINIFKRLYCEAGEENIKMCKRHQVSKILGSCPPSILPNSTRSVAEIAEMTKNMEWSKK